LNQLPILGNPLKSISCALRGLILLWTPGLRRYVWVPVLINLVLFSFAFWIASYYFRELIEWLIPTWMDWLRWLLWPLFGLTLLMLFIFTFSLLANLIAAPFYGRLAAKTEEIVFGRHSVQVEQLRSQAVFSSVGSELNRIWYFLSRSLPLLILLVIPGINFIASILWLIFSAWFLALEYMAYSLETRGLLFPQQRSVIKKHRLSAIAFGGIVMLGLAIPLLNLLVPAAAVIGATVYVADNDTGLVN